MVTRREIAKIGHYPQSSKSYMNESLLAALPALMPKAITWAKEQEARIRRDGQTLSVNQIGLAHAVGVKSPHLVRLLMVQEIPLPADGDLKAAGLATGLFSSSLAGMTFGHGIYIRYGHDSRSLLSHELRHVHQYEEAGSVQDFLSIYLSQVLVHGYMNSPLEIDARAHEISF